MVRVVHLTSVHPRNDIRVFHKECVSLAKFKDLQVSLVVADGKSDDSLNEVNILDVGAPKNRLIRIFLSSFLVFMKGLKLKADIYHFHDPELIFYGFLLKIFGKKVVFDIHEFSYVQIRHKSWIPSYLRKPISIFYKFIEDFFCRRFDLLVVPQDEMRDYYLKINSNVITAFNYPSKKDLIKIQQLPDFETRAKNLIYVGALSNDRGFSNMVKLIEELYSRDSGYTLFIAGQYSDEQLEIVKKSKAKDAIKLLGFLDRKSIKEFLISCGWGLILFNNVGQYYMANALKMFEYMSAGQILLIPDFGNWKNLNKEYRVGFNVNVIDAIEIADKICSIDCKLYEEFSKRNIDLVNECFVWEGEADKIYNAYRNI